MRWSELAVVLLLLGTCVCQLLIYIWLMGLAQIPPDLPLDPTGRFKSSRTHVSTLSPNPGHATANSRYEIGTKMQQLNRPSLLGMAWTVEHA